MNDFDIYFTNLKIWKDSKNVWIGIKEDLSEKIFLNVGDDQGVENINIGTDYLSRMGKKHFFQIFLKDIFEIRLKDTNLLCVSINI